MVTKSKILKAIAVFISLALLAQPTQALAWGGHDHHDSYHYPQYGRSSWWLPAAFATLAIAGMTYYYSQGVYYRRAPHGYVVVAPPEGAVVTTIPAGFETVNINGAPFTRTWWNAGGSRAIWWSSSRAWSFSRRHRRPRLPLLSRRRTLRIPLP